MTTIRLLPLDPDAVRGPVRHLVAHGGEPLRCCLRDARPGEPCRLVGYEPPLPAGSPYQERGAVFVHDGECDAPSPGTAFPTAWAGRPQVLRAYDATGSIHPVTQVHDGSDTDGTIRAMLEDAEVVTVHSRNVAYGCFMVAVERG